VLPGWNYLEENEEGRHMAKMVVMSEKIEAKNESSCS
jgi:hypothetical protein